MKALYYHFSLLFYALSFALLTPFFIMMFPNALSEQEDKQPTTGCTDSRGMECFLKVGHLQQGDDNSPEVATIYYYYTIQE